MRRRIRVRAAHGVAFDSKHNRAEWGWWSEALEGRRVTTRALKVRDHRRVPGPRSPAQRAPTWAGTTMSMERTRLEGVEEPTEQGGGDSKGRVSYDAEALFLAAARPRRLPG